MPPSPTNNTTRLILAHLFQQRVFAWRNNTGAIPLASGGFRGAAKKGTADILAVQPPTGRLIAIEVKTGSDKLSPEQIGFLASVEAAGGVAITVKDYDDFLIQYYERQ